MARIRPISDRVLVKLEPEKKEIGDSGISIPDAATSKPLWGTVSAAGPGRITKKGSFIPMPLRIGDRVCVPWRSGSDMKIGSNEYVMARLNDVIAIEGE